MQLSNNKPINDFIKNYYITGVIGAINSVNITLLEEITEVITAQIINGGRFFAFGNGGSEAIAGITIQLLEKVIPKSFQFDAYYPPIECELINNKNEEAFNQKILRSGRKGDVVFLISASGNSQNINSVSGLCRKKGLVSISLSGNGLIVKGENKATHNVIFDISDQQILEDATLAIINLLVLAVRNNLEKRRFDLEEIRAVYISDLLAAVKAFDFQILNSLVESVLHAYSNNHFIRIDSPDSGLLAFCAKHLEHNLKWDGLSKIWNRPVNKVFSGIPSCHYSGVANDGGDGYNHAIEIEDNLCASDVEIIFAKNTQHQSVGTAIKAATLSGCRLCILEFNSGSELIDTNLAQTVIHLTARILNSRLLNIYEYDRGLVFEEQLKKDLALLRQKNDTINRLGRRFQMSLQ